MKSIVLLYLGREMRSDVRDKLWRQLESEILLQRHKTVVRECRRNSNNSESKRSPPKPPPPQPPEMNQTYGGELRTVVVKRKQGQGLGISITVNWQILFAQSNISNWLIFRVVENMVFQF